MSIPLFHQIMLPLLNILEDKKEHSLREVIDTLTKHFMLSEQEQNELLSSGKQAVFDNRVGWARTYLKKAGLIISTRRGYFQITDRGLHLLGKKPAKIDIKFLEQFEEFNRFKTLRHEKTKRPTEEDDNATTPEEALANAYQNMKNELADELLQQIKASLPRQFENIVIDF